MRLLFIHQNLPGQFRHLLAHYATRPDCQVVALGERSQLAHNFPEPPPGIRLLAYDGPTSPAGAVHPYLRSTEQEIQRAAAVAQALLALRSEGFVPDVMIAHPGWGEALYVKQVFPGSKLLCYGEFYYAAEGRDFGFDPEFAADFSERLRLVTCNLVQLPSLLDADAIICPTEWQKTCLPGLLHERVSVVHDGIDTQEACPNPAARISLTRAGLELGPQDEVITFVSRNLEPHRGFHRFMRALPALLRARPRAHVIVAGGNGVSYGAHLGSHLGGKSWKQYLIDELDGQLDFSRLHFVGTLNRPLYLALLQVSTVHVYLTYPFVLSWSMLEAMSCGALLVGSRTAPVSEVITDGVNGLLVDFFSATELVDAINRVCDHPDRLQALRVAARKYVVQQFDLHRVCGPRQLGLIDALAQAS